MKNNKQLAKFYGKVIVPMVTPLTANGRIDELHSRELIRFLHKNGTTPFILGTTGESASISIPEREILVKILIENKRPDTPLLVGVGGLTYEDTVTLSNTYFDWGIDAVVLTLPNYFKLKSEQVYNYFSKLSDKINGDIILYNIPETINASIPIEAIDRLSRFENIVGIKDSENNHERLEQSLNLWRERKDFVHLVGVNTLMEEGLRLGSSGIVPSSGNLVPELYNRLYKEVKAGNSDAAKIIQDQTNQITNVYKDGFLLGESLAALKYLLSLQELCDPFMSSPLTILSLADQKEVKLKWEEIQSSAYINDK